MQSPNMTDNSLEIRADSPLEECYSIDQSFESVLDMFETQANIRLIEPKNVLDFLGDSEESTEISSIVYKLNTISNSCRKPERQNLNLNMDDSDSKSEILQILKFKGQTNTSSIPLRPVRNNVCQKNFGPFGGNLNYKFPNNEPEKVKKISLAGKVLKVKPISEKTKENEKFLDKKPERLTNPIKLNNNF